LFLLATCQSTSSLQSSSGTIRGPGYPGNYPNNAVYCWRIYVPSNYVVRLTINTLNMEVCTGCSCDSIELFNGYSESSSRIGKVCSKSWHVTSSGRYLFVKFTSDSTGTGTAFTASYYRLYKGKSFITFFLRSRMCT
jgi:cubilin